MVNLELLKEFIDKSGFKKFFIAEKLNITYPGLWNKLIGNTEFTVSEIRRLKELLNLGDDEFNRIFFAEDVPK